MIRSMLINQEQPYILPVCKSTLEILYEDEHIIACNKPVGLLSLPGKHPLNQDSVLNRLLENYPSAALAHRLDLDTSGIILAAKNKQSHAHLNKQFAERSIKKSYTAIINRNISQNSIPEKYRKHIDCEADDDTGLIKGRINLPMRANPEKKPTQQICFESGKQALTFFAVTHYDHDKDVSTVQLSPHTGRSHQLRLHCLSLGHPIIGCDLYADQAAFNKAPRLCLHASGIRFTHPDSLLPVFISCPASF